MGEKIYMVVIIIIESNKFMYVIYDRMLVILIKEEE